MATLLPRGSQPPQPGCNAFFCFFCRCFISHAAYLSIFYEVYACLIDPVDPVVQWVPSYTEVLYGYTLVYTIFLSCSLPFYSFFPSSLACEFITENVIVARPRTAQYEILPYGNKRRSPVLASITPGKRKMPCPDHACTG